MSAPLTAAQVATFPPFEQICENMGNHSLDHLAGYDVLVTTVVGAVTRVRVADSYTGADQYGTALEALQNIRAGAVSKGGYAYIANGYTCGCSEAGRIARTGGVEFVV